MAALKARMHALVAAAGQARVWVGVLEADAPPVITFRADGAPIVPAVVRVLAPALPDDLALAGGGRDYTGVFEIQVAAARAPSSSSASGTAR